MFTIKIYNKESDSYDVVEATTYRILRQPNGSAFLEHGEKSINLAQSNGILIDGLTKAYVVNDAGKTIDTITAYPTSIIGVAAVKSNL